jgi:rRNA maturation endonuclease Nob1
MKETASTSHPKDFQPADSPIEYEMRCFACGAPTEWPHDICDSCQKLTDLSCT